MSIADDAQDIIDQLCFDAVLQVHRLEVQARAIRRGLLYRWLVLKKWEKTHDMR